MEEFSHGGEANFSYHEEYESDSTVIQELKKSVDNPSIFFVREIVEYKTDIEEWEQRIYAQYSRDESMDAIEQVMNDFGIPIDQRDLLEKKLKYIADSIQRERALANLPERPDRDIRPYEGIIAYLKAPDGLGPWVEAGVLTRPLVSQLSPKAYVSLSNWLRNPRHSLEAEGLHIPNRYEYMDAVLEANGDVGKDLRRLRSAAGRREHSGEREM